MARQEEILSSTASAESTDPVTRLLQRVVEVRPDEVRALLLSCGYFFCILSAWFIMRPIREQTGVAGGISNLPWLYTGTLIATLVVHPPFAAMVARLPRRTFVTIANRFFLANILIFFGLFQTLPEAQLVWLGRVFFVWTSVFSLFVTSVFWSFMVDVFRTDQAKRLFGFIGFGGTLGSVTGAAVTATLAPRIGPVYLFLVSAVLLELAVQCVRRLSASTAAARPGAPAGEALIGGQTLAGIKHVIRSPYLLNICVYMLLFTIGSTVLYFQQAQIVVQAYSDRAAQTAFFARIDLAVNILTLLTQAFLTGRLIKALGVSVTLALLPALTVIGFLALGSFPILAVFVVFQVLRRAGEYAVARPTREVLYTVLDREDKYKAKHFIDTFVYRGGDQVGAWSMRGLTALGVGFAGASYLAAPFAVVWLGIALWLGRRHAVLARVSEAARAPAAPSGSPRFP
ncbi:MAG: MFS transporter [Gemmatimonadales bacterium]|nr:MFS transporter [Gemmatimonadales bacterium]